MDEIKLGKPVTTDVIPKGAALPYGRGGKAPAGEDYLIVRADFLSKPDEEWCAIFAGRSSRRGLPRPELTGTGKGVYFIVAKPQVAETWDDAKRLVDETNRIYAETVIPERDRHAKEQRESEEARLALLDEASRLVERLEP